MEDFSTILSSFNNNLDSRYGTDLQAMYESQMQATVDQYMQDAYSRYSQMADQAISSARSQIDSSRQAAMGQLDGVLTDMRRQGYSDSQIEQFRGQITSAIDERLEPTRQEVDRFSDNLRSEIENMYGPGESQTATISSTRTGRDDATAYSTNTDTISAVISGTSSSTRTGGADINISYDEMSNNLSNLKSGLNKLKSNWEGVIATNVAKLEASWVGDDCSAFITKLKESDVKVQKTIRAIELLITTYTQALETVRQNQSNVTNAIANSN